MGEYEVERSQQIQEMEGELAYYHFRKKLINNTIDTLYAQNLTMMTNVHQLHQIMSI